MKDSITVTWEVEDGYVGKSRPQTFEIPFSEFDDWDEAWVDDDIDETVEAFVRVEFQQAISYCVVDVEGEKELKNYLKSRHNGN